MRPVVNALVLLAGFALLMFGLLAIALTIWVGAPTFTGWTGIAGALAIMCGLAVWRIR